MFMTGGVWQLVLCWGVLVGLGTGSMALAFVATVTEVSVGFAASAREAWSPEYLNRRRRRPARLIYPPPARVVVRAGVVEGREFTVTVAAPRQSSRWCCCSSATGRRTSGSWPTAPANRATRRRPLPHAWPGRRLAAAPKAHVTLRVLGNASRSSSVSGFWDYGTFTHLRSGQPPIRPDRAPTSYPRPPARDADGMAKLPPPRASAGS